MQVILSTFDVLKLLKSRLVKSLQWLNIQDISVTSLVFK